MEGRRKGTSKGSTTVAVYIVVLESHPYVGLNRAATGKKSEGERGQKHFQNNHLLTDTDQQKATEKPNQEIKRKII